jgi:hypothetical protein
MFTAPSEGGRAASLFVRERKVWSASTFRVHPRTQCYAGTVTSKFALLIAAEIGLVTPVLVATRWDPKYEDPPPKSPREFVVPTDFQVPRLPALPHDEVRADCTGLDHVVTLDQHALTRDGQELARTPADPAARMLLPGDVLVPAVRKPNGLPEGVCLFIDARTPFGFARPVLRGLRRTWTATVVERADGARGRIELLPEEADDMYTPLMRVHKGSVTIDGTTIPALPSGAVDTQTLANTFRPKWTFSVLPDDDVPFGDVVAVVALYAESEFTDPALVVGPRRFSAGFLPPYKVVDLGAGSSMSIPMP